MSKRTYPGYPGVYPNPNNQQQPQGEEVEVLAEDGATALVKDKDGSTRHVPKGWLKR